MTDSQSANCKVQGQTTYHQVLSQRIDDFVDETYKAAKHFPSEELYVSSSQLRRAALSVALNYHEGHGRFTEKARAHFIRISFGSLRESLYIINFAKRNGFISSAEHEGLESIGKRVYAMLWGILRPK